MSEYAPDAIFGVYRAITVKSKEMSGILGDSAHTYGYHRCRYRVASDDYSVELQDDREGDGWAASALDIKFSAADMVTVSKRLLAAGKGNDPRLIGMREFFGTLNGTRVIGWDRHNSSNTHDDTPTTSDDSHLWHVHISFYRKYANNLAVIKKIADVINGVPYVPQHRPTPTPTGAHLRRAWPKYMGPSDYFGLESGPTHSHGGYYSSEQADVAAIQDRLHALGFYPGGDPRGHLRAHTRAAVAAWQRKHYAKSTSLFGQAWHDDWNRLFTY